MKKSRMFKLSQLCLILVVLFAFMSCEKDHSTVTPLSELDAVMKVAPPTLPSDGSFTIANPATNDDLKMIELKRIQKEKELLAKGIKGTPYTFTFDEQINITKNYAGTVIYDNTYAKAEIVSGGITFTPKFHFDLNATGATVNNTQAYIQNSASANATYKITLKASVSNTYSRNLTYWEQTAFTLVGGIVPVWVTFVIQTDAGCYVNASASCWVTQGVTASSTVKIGAKWVNGTGWSNISSYTTPTWSITSPSYGWNGNLTVQPYLNAFLSAKLYSVLGPQLLVTPYFTLYLNASGRYIDRTANLRGNVSFSLAGIGLPSVSYSQDVFNPSYTWPRIYF